SNGFPKRCGLTISRCHSEQRSAFYARDEESAFPVLRVPLTCLTRGCPRVKKVTCGSFFYTCGCSSPLHICSILNARPSYLPRVARPRIAAPTQRRPPPPECTRHAREQKRLHVGKGARRGLPPYGLM